MINNGNVKWTFSIPGAIIRNKKQRVYRRKRMELFRRENYLKKIRGFYHEDEQGITVW